MISGDPISGQPISAITPAAAASPPAYIPASTQIIGQPAYRRQAGFSTAFTNVTLAIVLSVSAAAIITRAPIKINQQRLSIQQPQPFQNPGSLYQAVAATPVFGAQIIGQPHASAYNQRAQFMSIASYQFTLDYTPPSTIVNAPVIRRDSRYAQTGISSAFIPVVAATYSPPAIRLDSIQLKAASPFSGFAQKAPLEFYSTAYIPPMNANFDNPIQPPYSFENNGFIQVAQLNLYTTDPVVTAFDDYIVRHRHRRSRR